MKKLFLMLIFFVCSLAQATVFTDLKFGQYQIADSQWNVSACTTTNTCQIYSTNPGTMYKIPWWNGQWSWQSGQYVQFSTTGDNTNPYEGKVYNSNGSLAGTIGTGHIVNMGTDSNGYNLFFFVGNDNNTGQLFSTNHGFTGYDGYTWTGTLNPTTTQVDSFASTGSTSPLAAGQNSSSSPTVVSTSTSDSVSSSSSSSNTGSVSVTRPTATGNYTDSYVGTTTTTVTTTTPVTTTTWSDGSTTTSNGTSSTSTTVSYAITPTLGQAPVYSRDAPNTSGNSIYLKQSYAWNGTDVSITQDGNNNAVTGITNGWAKIDGNSSAITTKQYGTGNIIGLDMNAWGNNITINQGTSSSDVSNNILIFDSHGNGNSVNLNQLSNSNTASVKLTYDINTVNLTQQTGTLNKSYITISGYWNTVNNTQTGSGNLAIVNISGDSNTATVNQTGTNHSALLNLINAGGANTVSITQTGSGDTYSLQQTCTNPAGCSVSVTRSK